MPIASGMSQMFESIIPEDVKAAIKEAREKLPAVIEAVKTKVDQIQARQDEMNRKLDVLLAVVSNLRLELIPGAVPEDTATAAAAFGLVEVKNGGSSHSFDS